MKIAVLSGKGGTGKTFISVNLASVASKAEYIDCDVEEPNGHLFFKPKIESEDTVQVMLPVVDKNLCNGNMKCVDFCRFNALAYIKDRLLIFNEICHSCGGCILVCPEKALSESKKTIGTIQRGKSEDVSVVTGILKTGEATGVPIITQMLMEAEESQYDYTFIDSPPGSACIVMESIKDADFCILVAEPTIFGAHNLAMVHELVELFEKPYGVILNKCTGDPNPSEEYCIENGIDIMAKIDFDHGLGLLNAQGEIVSKVDEKYEKIFKDILGRLGP